MVEKTIAQKVADFKRIISGNEIEKCVLCGCPTPYKKSDDIKIRKHYVEGAGQLCSKCYYY